MIFNCLFPPTNNAFDKPVTLYAICNSIANFGKEESEQTKISNLASVCRETIFDFDYPLSSVVDKEEFEKNIINKFMMRRIGFDTVTAFKLALNVKLNEIMPNYNILFTSINDWNLFNDGETETRNTTNNNTLTNTSTLDGRNSELPQNEIQDVQNGSYLTDYQYNTTSSNSTGNATGTETITRTQHDKINIYKEFIESKQNIYTMIYKDLECLFYQLI